MEKLIHSQNKEVRWGMCEPPWSWQSLTKGGNFSYLCVWGNGTSPLHLPGHTRTTGGTTNPPPGRQVEQVEKWLRRAEDQSLKLSLVSFPDGQVLESDGPTDAKCWTRNKTIKFSKPNERLEEMLFLKWRLYKKNTKVEWSDLWIQGHRSMLILDHECCQGYGCLVASWSLIWWSLRMVWPNLNIVSESNYSQSDLLDLPYCDSIMAQDWLLQLEYWNYSIANIYIYIHTYTERIWMFRMTLESFCFSMFLFVLQGVFKGGKVTFGLRMLVPKPHRNRWRYRRCSVHAMPSCNQTSWCTTRRAPFRETVVNCDRLPKVFCFIDVMNHVQQLLFVMR